MHHCSSAKFVVATAIFALLFCPGAVRAEDEETEHGSIVLEIGPAGEWPLSPERKNFGGAVGAEVTPIENWLEIELSLAALGTAGHTELSGDLLFKKPFRLTSNAEIMIGAGPSLSRTINGPERKTSWSAELAVDYFYWSSKNVGWFVEPSWSVAPSSGRQSIGVTGGLIVGFF